MARKYNYIYQSLVKGRDDFYGHFAYNAYKMEKIQFIEDFKTSNGGRLPSDSDLDVFHKKSLTKIAEYNRIGKEVADRMIKNLINDKLVQIQADNIATIKNQVEAGLASLPQGIQTFSKGKQFWSNVASSCVGTFFIALLPLLLAALCFFLNPAATKRYLKEVNPFSKEQVIDEQDSTTNAEL